MNAEVWLKQNWKHAITLCLWLATGPIMAGELSVLANFERVTGAGPEAGLIQDSNGNLYGTTTSGGAYGGGVVFQLAPPASGETLWTKTTITRFGGGKNGSSPRAGLIMDAVGNFYGTTSGGGLYGKGTVFQLTPPSSGSTVWTRKTLANFKGPNGAHPEAGLILTSAGFLYGTTYSGGTSDYGTVFRLIPPDPGKTAWILDTVVQFNGANGMYPHAGLIDDADGNMYGTTRGGGKYPYGTVYRLTSGEAHEVLYNFNWTNGAHPMGELTLDTAGNLYGTTSEGGGVWGSYVYGTVFQLSPPTPDKTAWTRKALFTFNNKMISSNGRFPESGLVFDNFGNLYGTTNGTLFKLSPPLPGKTRWNLKTRWNFSNLFSFARNIGPKATLLMDSTGNLYGTTDTGGKYGRGMAFRFSP